MEDYFNLLQIEDNIYIYYFMQRLFTQIALSSQISLNFMVKSKMEACHSVSYNR